MHLVDTHTYFFLKHVQTREFMCYVLWVYVNSLFKLYNVLITMQDKRFEADVVQFGWSESDTSIVLGSG